MPLEKEPYKRRHQRHECSGDAQVVVVVGTVPLPAKVLELSIEGCRIMLGKGQTIADETKVELAFSVNRLPFRVWGVAKGTRQDGSIGFHFPALSQRVRNQLEDLAEELR
jgi:PilZ domain